MNTKQKLQDFILKYKDQKEYEVLVNELCRLYFEVESDESEDPKPQIKLSGFVLEKDDIITEQGLLELGFVESASGKSFILQLPNEFTFSVEINAICIHFSIQQKQHVSPIPFIKHETTISELKELIKIIFRVEL